jgi:LuxR family maltose regulon positive regulatory protein
LTVVTGMAGAGKTALVSGWARRRGAGMTAWIGLEEADNDRRRFWRRLVGGLQRVDARAGLTALDAVSMGADDVRAAEALVADAAGMSPAVVVLDDLHVLVDPSITDAVGYLSRHLPPHVHLIVAGRKPPGFVLHRLRLSGEVSELSAADLRFSLEEAQALLGSTGDGPVGPDEVELIVERCEGWAAGLRFAALARPDGGPLSRWARGATRERELVADYFSHEVLATLPADTRQFVLDTSVLDELSAWACSEVTGRADAGRVLASLARDNVFVVPLDEPGRGHRYHRQLAEFLTSRFALENPVRWRAIHRRVAAWCEREGTVGAAVGHLVMAGAGEEAFSLAARAVAGQVDGRFGCGEAWLPGGLPDSFFEHDPARTWALAAGLLCAGQVAEAARWLRHLERLAPGETAAGWWQRRTEWLWALHDGLLGDGQGVLGHHRSSRGPLDWPGGPGEADGRDAWEGGHDLARAIERQVAVVVARAHLWLDHTDEALDALNAGCGDETTPDSARLGVLALAACRQGRLRDAHVLGLRSLEEAERNGRAGAMVSVDARLALGMLHWEQHDLAAAEAQLEMALAISSSAAPPPVAVAVEHQLIRVLVSLRRADDALRRTERLRRAEQTRPLPAHLSIDLDHIEIGCRLALGDLKGASRILKAMPAEGRTALVASRVDLCAGRPDRAVGRLTAAPCRAPAIGTEVERLSLLGRAELQLGNRRRADDAIRRAIECGRPERFIRPFVDAAPELLPLLHDLAGVFPDIYVAELVTHASQAGVSRPSTTSVTTTLEPLTDREREILSHLTGHLTQHEIASGMYVSVNTVKSHVKCVYRKLGAGSRSEAVALARAHGLL